MLLLGTSHNYFAPFSRTQYKLLLCWRKSSSPIGGKVGDTNNTGGFRHHRQLLYETCLCQTRYFIRFRDRLNCHQGVKRSFVSKKHQDTFLSLTSKRAFLNSSWPDHRANGGTGRARKNVSHTKIADHFETGTVCGKLLLGMKPRPVTSLGH